jgi:hypothetical protein
MGHMRRERGHRNNWIDDSQLNTWAFKFIQLFHIVKENKGKQKGKGSGAKGE